MNIMPDVEIKMTIITFINEVPQTYYHFELLRFFVIKKNIRNLIHPEI